MTLLFEQDMMQTKNMRWIKNIKSQFALARLKGRSFFTSIYII